MKLFLDDEREAPDGWIRIYHPDEMIRLLENGNITHISLDHDLGNDEAGTGYDVILWIEEAVATRGFNPPQIKIHSANPSARIKMELGIAKIQQLAGNSAGHPE